MKIQIIKDDDSIREIEVEHIKKSEKGSQIATKGKRKFYSPDGKLFFEID